MKILGSLVLLFLLTALNKALAQDSLAWQLSWQLPLDSASVWQVDPFSNLLIGEKDEILKYDSLGKIRFRQSSKYFGRITQIEPSNPMKTLIFSDQQQIVGYIDNALAKQQENIELSDFGLSYVTLVATSSQPDKFWVYDQDNSKIVLLSTNEQQGQLIENVSGLLGCREIIRLFEKDTYLYIVDRQKGIYQFDNYGTLLFHWNIPGILWAEFDEKYAYLLRDNHIDILQLENEDLTRIDLPTREILQFRKLQNTFYFRTKEQISKFSLLFFPENKR